MNPKESRKEWLEMIFRYHAKYNKRSGEEQFWTHENHAVELARIASLKHGSITYMKILSGQVLLLMLKIICTAVQEIMLKWNR